MSMMSSKYRRFGQRNLTEAMAWSLDWAEAMTAPLFGSPNGTAEERANLNSSMSVLQAFDDALLGKYYGTLFNMTKALNDTGVQAAIDFYVDNLTVRDNYTSMLPASDTSADNHTVDPFIPFLQQMAEYNNIPFTDGANTTSMSSLTEFLI